MKRSFEISKDLPKQQADGILKQLKLGFMNLRDDFFEQAEMNFSLALQMDEKCSDAHWGMMLCKLHVKNEDELYQNPVTYKNAIYLPECEKALQYASQNLKKTYEGILERIYKINEGENY